MARSGLDRAQGPGGWGGARVTHPLFASVVPPLEVQDELFPHCLVSAGGDGKGPVSSAGAGTTNPAAGGSPASAPRWSVSSDARSPRNEPPTATCLILSADPEAPHPHKTEPGLQKRGPLGAPGFLPHRGRPSPHSHRAPPARGGHHPTVARLPLPGVAITPIVTGSSCPWATPATETRPEPQTGRWRRGKGRGETQRRGPAAEGMVEPPPAAQLRPRPISPTRWCPGPGSPRSLESLRPGRARRHLFWEGLPGFSAASTTHKNH